jgi:hypothetical protein
MTQDDLERIIQAGQETRTVEFKSAGAWSDVDLRAQVIRVALSMANTRDGGVLLVGMAELADRPGYHVPEPLTEEQWRSFDPDTVVPQINAHAFPHLDVVVSHSLRANGDRLVSIEVAPFRDVPVLCARPIVGGNNRLLVAEGRILVRSRRTPETTELRSGDDLRELIEVVVDRGLESYFRRRRVESAAVHPDDARRFLAELGDLAV